MKLRPALALAICGVLITAPAALSSVAVRHNGTIAYSDGADVGLLLPSGAPAGRLPDCAIPGCNVAGPLAWSPGGRKLAFVRGTVHGGSPVPWKFALFVSSANGAHPRRLLACDLCSSAQGASISWSPGGSAIVVNHARRLALVNVKTGSHRLVASCAAGSRYLPWSPAWSPDGSKIAFACGSSLYLVGRTGRPARVIAKVPGGLQPGDLSWSPNGKALAFDAADGIYTVRADGSHLRTLLSGAAGSGPGFPSWSPDGTRIVYAYTPGTPNHFFFEVWVMNVDGSRKHRLYRSSQPLGDYAPPIWSPNGKYIAFSIVTNSESGLMIMHADGSALHRIAPPVERLAWQPLP